VRSDSSDAEAVRDPGHHAHRGERVTSQQEEVVVGAHAIGAEQIDAISISLFHCRPQVARFDQLTRALRGRE
jgi:hypothetical protein